MNKLSMIVFLILLIISGCVTSKPMMSMVKDVSLADYKVFEVPPILNETRKTFEFDVADTLTQNIKSKLRDKGYKVSDGTATSEKVLIIRSSLLSYEPGSAFKRWLAPGFGKTQATVRTYLIDKKTGKVLGELVSADTVSAGGLYSAGSDKRILDAITEGIVDEIEKKAKGE
jgi:hypothetical protein